MVKITGSSPASEVRLKMDHAVPYSLTFGVEATKVWSCTPDEGSRFEIWTDAKGAIARVALLTADPARRSDSKKADDGPKADGKGEVPTSDIAGKTSAQDPFELVLGPDYVSVQFKDAGKPKEWIVNEKSRFGVDAKGRLSRFDLIGLSEDDVRSILGALGA